MAGPQACPRAPIINQPAWGCNLRSRRRLGISPLQNHGELARLSHRVTGGTEAKLTTTQGGGAGGRAPPPPRTGGGLGTGRERDRSCAPARARFRLCSSPKRAPIGREP